MNYTEITLNIVEHAISNLSKDKNEYVRVSFEGHNDKGLIIKVKTSMSIKQWNELKKSMDLVLNIQDERIVTNNSIKLKFDQDGVTKSKKLKPLCELKKGVYKEKTFNYYEINVGVFIENNIVTSDGFTSNYKKLF